jgi:hypothetical protein
VSIGPNGQTSDVTGLVLKGSDNNGSIKGITLEETKLSRTV